MEKINYFAKSYVILAVLFLVSVSSASAQNSNISAAFRNQTIEMVLRLLKDKYAYPEIALKMEAAIRERQKRGEYDLISDGEKLAEKITSDLRQVFDDKHLKLSYSAEPIMAQSAKAGAPSAEEIEQARRRQTRENFGLQKVEILKGNVGLIKLNYFAPLSWAADVYSAALNTIVNTDALVIDVRENGGSMDINTIPFFCSYFFNEPQQIGEMFTPETNETRQLWTYAQVPGKKYLDKPIFILISNKTASGAEAFVGQMKRLKRAVLIGETTRGATLPGRSNRVNEHFSIWISFGRAPNAIAQNENKGTTPDITVLSEKALTESHRQAINRILQTATDEDWKIQLKTLLAEIKGKK